ncbi:MAG TPA: TlpA disulfide reductase family protein [Pseudobdellovibrionaceae bacterium]|nr:TlpA disulfide reductase family protein [Pseudobdellovibrionaceae bacterium]
MNTSIKKKISLLLIGVGLLFAVFILVLKPMSQKLTPVEEILNKKNIFGFKTEKTSLNKDYYIFNFWASWCPPCIEETPSLIRFVLKNSDKYHLFAISQDSSTKDIEDFIKTFPNMKNSHTEIIWDDNRNLAQQLNIFKLPETLIYSTKTKKFLKISGATNWESPGFEDYVINYFINN